MIEMKRIPLTNEKLPGVEEAGVEAMLCCGVQDEKEALAMAAIVLENEKAMTSELSRLG